jgi:hypothetical protein
LDWTPTTQVWTALSWIVTIALVSLGWIFFRANSLPQARQMLSAMGSISSYSSHFLTGSLYLLVLALAAGYTMVLLVADALERSSSQPEAQSPAILAIARWRWFWLPPLYALALLFVLIITLTQGADTAQFMYRGF